MKPHQKILLELKMLDIGIIPNTDHNASVVKHFEEMTSEQARKSKRKWRKLKRKALKKSAISRPNPTQEKFAVIMMLTRDIDT